MARYINCIAPVESMIGKLGQKDKISGNGNQNYIGFRRKYSAVNRFALRTKEMVYAPNKVVAALARQAKFRAVVQLATLRLKDANKRLLDEAAWKKQTKYKTLFGYVFHDEWISYEDE